MSLDDAAFESLYREEYERVLRYALRRTRPEMAEDIVATTFSIAWRRRASVPADPGAWLLGIARKVIANERRSARRQAAFLGRNAHDLVPSARDGGSDSDAEATVRPVIEAMKILPARDRELLLLIAWDELTPREAARVLDLPVLTCRVRLHRARRRLAAELTAIGVRDPEIASERSPLSKRPI